MNNIKILVCIVFIIFLLVTTVIKIVMNLKDQSTSSFEIDEVDNNFEESTNTFRYEIDEVDNNLEESTNTFRSTEAIELFFGKLSFIVFHN